MTWIDDRLAEREKVKTRNKLVELGSAKILDDLWGEVLRAVEEGKDKGLPLRTNGSAYERVLIQFVFNPSSQEDGRQRELTIRLLVEEERISVSGPSISLQFSIDVSDDNVVCLKHDGQPVALSAIAKMILDPFLFPEFQPKHD